jgi:mannose-6-phosphate isomerase-like protein (cupin superfamily)
MATIAAAMKTPPGPVRRPFEKQAEKQSHVDTSLCSTGYCALLRMVREAFTSERKTKEQLLDEKLDDLAGKIDLIARQITQERQVTQERQFTQDSATPLQKVQEEGRDDRLDALEDLECDGLEVARYSQIPQFDASILDTFIPRCRRLTQLHFGAIVSNPHAPMAFSEKMGYNMTYNLVPPGNGNALHMHRAIEIFVALDGKWEIAWGMQGEHTVMLEPWDFVCVPARVCHSYKNIEEQTAQNIMTILPGKSWITWAPNVVKEAREHGAECDDHGVLLKYAKMVSQTSGLGGDASTVEWRSMGPDDMAPFLHRFKDQRPMECRMTSVKTPDGKAPFIEMFWKTIQSDASTTLPRRAGVDLLLVVLDGSVLIKTASGRPVAAAGRLDCVRVPTEALAESEVVVYNPCPTPCVLLVVATEMRSQNDMYFHLC